MGTSTSQMYPFTLLSYPTHLFLILGTHTHMQLFELLLINRRRCVHQQIQRALCLGKCNHLTDIIFVGQQHDETVYAERNTSVRRCAILESFEHMPKLLCNLLVIQFHQREHFVLQVRHIDTHTATANFIAIADDVVLLCTNIQRVCIETRDMRLVHTGEWVMLSLVTLSLFIKMQQGKIHNPAERHLVRVNQLETLSKLYAQAEENI